MIKCTSCGDHHIKNIHCFNMCRAHYNAMIYIYKNHINNNNNIINILKFTFFGESLKYNIIDFKKLKKDNINVKYNLILTLLEYIPVELIRNILSFISMPNKLLAYNKYDFYVILKKNYCLMFTPTNYYCYMTNLITTELKKKNYNSKHIYHYSALKINEYYNIIINLEF